MITLQLQTRSSIQTDCQMMPEQMMMTFTTRYTTFDEEAHSGRRPPPPVFPLVFFLRAKK
tara:strand:- start:17 stop:196 length:180 start_codon:yes stop_codon:yes gene_type:complete